jgi:hypothetical protein
LGADYLPESKVEVKNEWSYTSSLLYGFSKRKLPSHSSNRKWQGNGKNFTVRRFVICNLHECYLNYWINKDKMGETCSTNKKVLISMQNFGKKNSEGKESYENTDRGRIILKKI